MQEGMQGCAEIEVPVGVTPVQHLLAVAVAQPGVVVVMLHVVWTHAGSGVDCHIVASAILVGKLMSPTSLNVMFLNSFSLNFMHIFLLLFVLIAMHIFGKRRIKMHVVWVAKFAFLAYHLLQMSYFPFMM